MNKEMIAFFDGLAHHWNNDPEKHEVREKIIARSNVPKNSVIADIGCGTGVMIEHLLKTKPARLLAIDISSQMIGYAKSKCNDSRIEYVNGDYITETLPALDVAIIYNAYPHFLNKEALIKKLARDIKEEGTLIIAHSMSKERINGVHDGEKVGALSLPLEKAQREADKFKGYFKLDSFVDNHEFYFVRMTRTKFGY